MAGFNPNQPRDADGQWAKSVSVSVGAKDYAYYKNRLNEFPVTTWEFKKLKGLKHEIPRSDPDSEILEAVDWLENNGEFSYDMLPEEYVAIVEKHFKEELEKSDVYMRINEAGLKKALNDEMFKNTFMTGKTKAAYRDNGRTYNAYAEIRAEGENLALGVPTDSSPDNRPIYGYFAQDHDTRFKQDPWLEQYGDIAVKFNKESISDYLTFTDTDSLDSAYRVRSSDWRDPKIVSGIFFTNHMFYNPEDDFFTPDKSIFWEAQIYDRSTSNIAELIFSKPPSDALLRLIEKRKIPWRIVTP